MDTAVCGRSMRSRGARSALLGFVLTLLLSACQAPGTTATTFYNPLNSLDGPDPWLQYYEGNYYLTSTQTSAIRMWKSPTIAGLATAKPATIWSDSTSSRCCNVWAPEFHLLDGPNGPRWYVYYSAGTDGTLDNQRMHVLESSGTDPLGPYTYKARIYDPANDVWSIDGSILKMPDGKLYFLFSSWVGPDQTMFIAPMSNPWTISGSRVAISKPTYDWERSVGNVNEGPEALQHNGKTFIIYSASACWGDDYKLGMLTYNGGDVLSADSWVKHAKPVFEKSDANKVYSPGHNGFFTSPDGAESWIVYHANSAAGDGCVGKRTTRVQKFTWNDDGTPNFGVPLSLDTAVAAPSGERGTPQPPASVVYYTVVNKNSEKCLEVKGSSSSDGAQVQQQTCSDGAGQQWSLDYLANGYYRLLNRNSAKALEAAGGPSATQDGAAIQQSSWVHGANQQWRLLLTTDGWVRIEARHSGKVLGIGGCGKDDGASAQQGTWQEGSDCQQFRLQPLGQLKILNENSVKPLTIEKASMTDGANLVLWSDTNASEQRWSFVHQDNGYYQIMAAHSGKCLGAIGGTTGNGAKVAQQNCSSGANQQWRLDPLNDGMIRLVGRSDGKVIDVANCRMADGATTQMWVWMNNSCQRFRLAAP
jgi:GH43 family beta-xylosidase